MKTIRELRLDKGWTQYDLALKLGVHPQAVYLWESGRRTPLVPQMRKMGRLFELCSDDIRLESRPAAAKHQQLPKSAISDTPPVTASDDKPESL